MSDGVKPMVGQRTRFSRGARPISRPRSWLLPLASAACVALIVLASSYPAAPQARQPFSDEAVQHLVRAALFQYFDTASVFEIQALGSALAGDVLSIDTLLINGKPAVLRSFRGEVLAHFTGLQLEMSALAVQQLKTVRLARATVVAKSTAKAVEEGLAKASATILRPTVRFEEGQMEIAATIRRGDKLYPAQARAALVVEGKQRVMVVVTYALVHGSSVPQGLVESELAKINPVLDLSKWPFNLQIQRLVLHNDAIEVLATSGR